MRMWVPCFVLGNTPFTNRSQSNLRLQKQHHPHLHSQRPRLQNPRTCQASIVQHIEGIAKLILAPTASQAQMLQRLLIPIMLNLTARLLRNTVSKPLPPPQYITLINTHNKALVLIHPTIHPQAHHTLTISPRHKVVIRHKLLSVFKGLISPVNEHNQSFIFPKMRTKLSLKRFAMSFSKMLRVMSFGGMPRQSTPYHL